MKTLKVFLVRILDSEKFSQEQVIFDLENQTYFQGKFYILVLLLEETFANRVEIREGKFPFEEVAARRK